ncbi:hypothetical protein NCC49_001775 [Naganishia albida]|nr:hypothetical protein NCC49_001775 [Naganishia albida]
MSSAVFNYSLYTIPLAWTLAYTFNRYARADAPGWSYAQPRSNITPEGFKANGIPPKIAAKITRASSASANGMENVPLYAAGVVAANCARLSASSANMICLAYLLSRLAYNTWYIHTTDESWAKFRTVLFYVGHVLVLSLFVMSASALSAQ